MSHISKAKAKIQFNNQYLLEKSLLSLKGVKILQDTYLFRETGSRREIDKSKGKFDYVIQKDNNKTLRVGIKKNNDTYDVYYDNWGETGRFANEVVSKLNDWYIAYSTAEAIKQTAKEKFEDYNINVFEDEESGEIIVEAQENIW